MASVGIVSANDQTGSLIIDNVDAKLSDGTVVVQFSLESGVWTLPGNPLIANDYAERNGVYVASALYSEEMDCNGSVFTLTLNILDEASVGISDITCQFSAKGVTDAIDVEVIAGSVTLHKFDQKIKNEDTVHTPAGCTTDAVYYYSCECGEIGENTFVDRNSAKGHRAKSSVKKATFTKNGSITKTCSECGEKISSDIIAKVSSVKLSATEYVYNGKAKTPTVTVKASSKTLKKDTDYSVKYASGRKDVGKYKVTIALKGNYSGEKVLYFTIVPAETKITKVTSAKKSLKVTFTKKTVQVTGYEIQYATNKSFKSAKTKTLTKNSYTSTTLSKLSSKKTYYVRIRTYKTVSGKKYYSDWSSAKYGKTK